MRLSGRDSKASCPSISLPAALFPDPDLPSNTRRSSGEDEDEDNEGEEGVELDEELKEGEAAKVGEEGKEEEKTGERGVVVGEPSGDLSSKLLILW